MQQKKYFVLRILTRSQPACFDLFVYKQIHILLARRSQTLRGQSFCCFCETTDVLAQQIKAKVSNLICRRLFLKMSDEVEKAKAAASNSRRCFP